MNKKHEEKPMQENFEKTQKDAIIAAKDLCYDRKFIDELRCAKNFGELERILINARHAKFGDGSR